MITPDKPDIFHLSFSVIYRTSTRILFSVLARNSFSDDYCCLNHLKLFDIEYIVGLHIYSTCWIVRYHATIIIYAITCDSRQPIGYEIDTYVIGHVTALTRTDIVRAYDSKLSTFHRRVPNILAKSLSGLFVVL